MNDNIVLPEKVDAFPLGPLTALAIGDAVGAGVEFNLALPMASIKQRPSLYVAHTMYPFLPAGSYSDDTQRAAAIVATVMANKRDEDFGPAFEKQLLDLYRVDPRGYGSKMFAAFQYCTEHPGVRLSDALGISKRDSAGAAMGASVLGVLHLEEARRYARMQAELTHMGDGIIAAELVAAMSYYLTNRVSHTGVRELLAEDFPIVTSQERIKRPGNKGLPCALAALQCIEEAESLLDLLLRCLSLGGDTDTVVSIALGCTWNCRELANDLPPYLWIGLEANKVHLRMVEMAYLDSRSPQRGLRVA